MRAGTVDIRQGDVLDRLREMCPTVRSSAS